MDNRLGCLVAVICVASLAGSDGVVVDQLEKMFSVASDNCKLLAVLAEGVELVGESSLELLTGDVGKLGLGNEGFCLSTDELLL